MAKVKSKLNIDLEISPMPLSAADRAAISNAIADYKQSGRKSEMPVVRAKCGNTQTPTVAKGSTTKKTSQKKSSLASIKQ
ncbi:MAG: hypothetical protein U0U46_08810 [Saprospiraceae bacterium]|nr:hypothetical protein [Saprospiraceae bacterium]HNL38209.1 hypothetical protein [Saprospiraceae bacterium]